MKDRHLVPIETGEDSRSFPLMILMGECLNEYTSDSFIDGLRTSLQTVYYG